MIENSQHRIKRAQVDNASALLNWIESVTGNETLRWYIGQLTGEEVVLEATRFNGGLRQFNLNVDAEYYPDKTALLSVIPTVAVSGPPAVIVIAGLATLIVAVAGAELAPLLLAR